MYCRFCGKEVRDDDKFCHECGAKLDGRGDQDVFASGDPRPESYRASDIYGNYKREYAHKTGDDRQETRAWSVLGFFVSPVVAIILCLAWYDSKRARAKLILKGMIASIIVGVVVWMIAYAIMIISL